MSSKEPIGEPVAIIGAATRLPGCRSLNDYWSALREGRDLVTEVPDGRWSKAAFYHPHKPMAGRAYTWSAGVLDDVRGFDAAFFGISPREAEQIDPQQRLMLELAWEAIEDAGVPSTKLAGSQTGVYIGFSSAEYANIRIGDPAGADAYFMTGTTGSIVANRVSYILDLHGPSFVVDTACSSSLVALDAACRALRAGQIATAIVGGVNLLLSPYPFIGFCNASMLSRRGRCHAFDARADGYVRGEGGGAVLLKPLKQARADGDRIRAVIMGTGVNSDGKTVGLSLPSLDAQKALLRQVYGEAGIDPESLAFIEAHGTGTPAGDPIEVGALGEVLAGRRSSPLWIGSAKTNIGHLETASGMAGLLKAMLALEHRQLPPSLHFETPNPRIDFDRLNLRVAAQAVPLLAEGALYAGVNSFGFGGTNAHAVLASAEQPPPAAAAAPPGLLLSARSRAALLALAEQTRPALQGEEFEVAARARGLARRRDHHGHRLMVAGSDPANWGKVLDRLRAEGASPDAVIGEVASKGALAFVYSGNGAQWFGMARDALAHSPEFRAALQDVDAVLAPLLGWSALARLEEEDTPEAQARTDVAQPLLFAIQVALTQALRSGGAQPQVYLGHSVGEIAAAWAADALTLEDACRVVVARSIHQQRTQGAGRMAAVGAAAAAVMELISELDLPLELAAINSRVAVTVAGPAAAIEALAEPAGARGWRYIRLDLDYAFHSSALDGVEADLLEDLTGLRPVPCDDRFISTVTGEVLHGPLLDNRYWWRNVREPVAFESAVAAAAAAGVDLFLEIGPAPVLQSYMREGLRAAEVQGAALPSLTRDTLDRDPVARILATLYVNGHDITRAEAWNGPAMVDGLAPYPWQKEPFWTRATGEKIPIAEPATGGPLLGHQFQPGQWVWTRTVDGETLPWLADHAVEGVPVLPAAAMVEMALEAARVIFPDAIVLEVANLDIVRALTAPAGEARQIRCSVNAANRFRLESRPRLTDEGWTLHASAELRQGQAPADASEPADVDPEPDLTGQDLYRMASRAGLNYGPAFQAVRHVAFPAAGRAAAALQVASLDDGLLLAPNGLDAALQVLIGLVAQTGDDSSYLPSRFGDVRLLAPFGRLPARAEATLRRKGSRALQADLRLFDVHGDLIALAQDCWLQRVQLSRAPSVSTLKLVFEPESRLYQPASSVQLMRKEQDGDDAGLMIHAFLVAAAREAISASGEDGLLTPPADEAARWLAGYLTDLVVAAGAAIETDDGCRLTAADWPDADVIWRTLLADRPELGAELALLSWAADNWKHALRRDRPSVPPPESLRDAWLFGSPQARAATDALVQAMQEVLRAWPADQTIQLLELGAVSPVLVRALVPVLESASKAWRVTLAAPDEDAAARLRGAFADDPRIAVVVWTSGAPGRPASGFDLVLSLHGLTRLALGPEALASVAETMRSGALLLAAEPGPNVLWDALFSHDPAWWDGSAIPALPVSRLKDADSWRRLWRTAGFDVAIEPHGDGLWATSVLSARAPVRAAGLEQADLAGRTIWIAGAIESPVAMALRAEGEASGARVWLGEAPPADIHGAPIAVYLGHHAEDAAGLASVAGALAHPSLKSGMAILVTEAAQAHAHARPEQAALWGLGRTLMNERPDLDGRLVDLAPGLAPASAARALLASLSDSQVREARLSETGREVLRWMPARLGAQDAGADVRLEAAEPGLLDSLTWTPLQAASVGPGEVRIDVRAAGLNFRDVMWAQGLLPEEALIDGFAGSSLGLECAGIVTEVGAAVETVVPGDRVIAFAPAALASSVVTKGQAVARLPDSIPFEAGATLPVTFMTVLYALGEQARLERDEWILIHGAAGGVGLAAIQYAQQVGARIIATAGSPVKRAVLRRLGVEHVLDSRSLDFVEGVRAATAGQGVHVVLNSLSGQAMQRSLELLRPFGRFVELGKRDFYEDTLIGLRPMRRNLSYFAIDADALPAQAPERVQGIMARIEHGLEDGSLRPLPYRAFDFQQASEAFRLMQGSGHIGKIVLRRNPAANRTAPRRLVVHPDRAYVVTGGLSGFGLETARWLVDRGARKICLLGRRGPHTPGAEAVLAEFEQRGVEIRALSCDVADRSALEAALNEVREALGVIGGVVHAAMGISDGLLDRLDPEALDRVLAPKLGGARNLDELTRDDPLDLFLLYSSATTLIGAPGQGGYVAANLAVEALARSRAAAGLPALAVAWGPIADVGYLARDEAAQQQLGRRLGAKALPARQALDALPSLAALGEPVVAYADIQWGALNGALPLLRSAAFDFLRSEADEPDDSDLGDRLRNLPEAEAVDLLTQVLVEEVARILGCGVDRVAPRRPLVQLGMDSLMALELRTGLERRIGIDLPLMALSDNTTLHSLARRTIAGLSQTPVIANPVAAAALAHEAGSLELLTKPTHREAAE